MCNAINNTRKLIEGSNGETLPIAIAHAVEVLKNGIGQFKKSYGGKVGCACGCRGTYSTKPAVLTRRYNEMLAALTEQGWEASWVCTSYNADGTLGWVAINLTNDNDRAITLYTDDR